jgi:16S rRNA (guanine527-N7)-methyltransferase
VLAIARPDLRVTLVEPLLRRVTWLHEVIDDLDLPGVAVVRGRAEEVRGVLSAEVLTARAVAALPRLAAWCRPLIRPGGELLAIKGDRAQQELDEHRDRLRAMGFTRMSVQSCAALGLSTPTTVTVLALARRRA